MSTVQPLCCPTFMDSAACQGLRSACHSAEKSRRFYLHAAARMEEAALHVVGHAFCFAAAQEREHADVLRGLLIAHGGSWFPQAEEAVVFPAEPLDLLRAAALSAHERWDELLPAYARSAQAEGYPRIARTFLRIAETELTHARRFAQYMSALKDGTLLRDERRVSWFCLNCGQLHTGCEPPLRCSGCGRDRGHFIRSDLTPFLVEG